MNGGMMNMMGWMMAPWWWLGWALVIGSFVVIGAGVVWAVRRSRPESPVTILKRRYAQGAITTEPFELMKQQLNDEQKK